MLAVVLLVPVAWLLGTFPTAVLVARAHGHDVTREGSGNPGASNVARLVGWRAGALVLVCDFAKGAVAAGVGYAVGGRPGHRAVPADRARTRGRVVRRRASAAQGVARVAARCGVVLGRRGDHGL